MEEFLSPEEIKTILDDIEGGGTDWHRERLSKPIKYGTVYYYYVPKSTRYNDQPVMAVTFGLWLERNLKHRGLSDRYPVESRTMTRDEAIEEMLRTRYYMVYYDSWQALIDDDRKFGVPEPFLDKMITYSKHHRLRVPYDPNYVPPVEPLKPEQVTQKSLFPTPEDL